VEPRLPRIDRFELSNGARVASTSYSGTPETLIQLQIPAGRSREPLEQLGLASLVAKAMNEGTRALSTVEWIDAIDLLGANLHVFSDDDALTLSLRVLDKHLEKALELFADALLEPRFHADDFERVRKLRLAALATRADDAATVAQDAWQRLMYGAATSLGWPAVGTAESVARLGVNDLREFHRAALDPRASSIAVVSRWNESELLRLLSPLAARWPASSPSPCEATPFAAQPAAPGLYCVDRPGAAQTELHVGFLSVSARDPDWLALSALNYPFGGQFTSRINLELREKRGFTYGARSAFEAALRKAPFTVHAAVHTQHTAEAIRVCLAQLSAYLDGPTEAEIAFTRDALEQSLARQFESPAARMSYLQHVERFGWPGDYPLVRLAQLATLGRAGLRALARRHLAPPGWVILAVGPRSALAGLDELGPVHALDAKGAPV
jgi:zinc protease